METNSSTRLDPEQVRRAFTALEAGDGSHFFDHVAADVDWTVEGTHPLAGRYHTKQELRQRTFDRLSRVLPGGAHLRVTHVLLSGDWAVVELESRTTARNGLPFDNHYCWLTRFEGGKIVEVRAYLDSALVQRVLDENRA